MRIKKVMPLVLLTMILAQSSFISAQEINGAQAEREWAGISEVSPGDRLRVERFDGRRVAGRLRSVSETELTLTRGRETINLNRSDIRRIYRFVGGRAGRGALTGAAIGGASGAVTGAVIADSDYRGLVAGSFGFLGAGIGAIIGAVRGGRAERVLIYEAR